MNKHENIRELLAMAAAGALTDAEEKQVAEHVRSCGICSNELEAWRWIAEDLCRLRTPQPSSRLMQATIMRVEANLADRAEHDWNRNMLIFVVAVGWLLTAASWLVFHLVSTHFGTLLAPQFGRTWISFVSFTALAWFTGGVAAVMLAVRLRRERGVA